MGALCDSVIVGRLVSSAGVYYVLDMLKMFMACWNDFMNSETVCVSA